MTATLQPEAAVAAAPDPLVLCFLAARETMAFGFLIFWASSQTITDHFWAAKENSRSRRVS